MSTSPPISSSHSQTYESFRDLFDFDVNEVAIPTDVGQAPENDEESEGPQNESLEGSPLFKEFRDTAIKNLQETNLQDEIDLKEDEKDEEDQEGINSQEEKKVVDPNCFSTTESRTSNSYNPEHQSVSGAPFHSQKRTKSDTTKQPSISVPTTNQDLTHIPTTKPRSAQGAVVVSNMFNQFAFKRNISLPNSPSADESSQGSDPGIHHHFSQEVFESISEPIVGYPRRHRKEKIKERIRFREYIVNFNISLELQSIMFRLNEKLVRFIQTNELNRQKVCYGYAKLIFQKEGKSLIPISGILTKAFKSGTASKTAKDRVDARPAPQIQSGSGRFKYCCRHVEISMIVALATRIQAVRREIDELDFSKKVDLIIGIACRYFSCSYCHTVLGPGANMIKSMIANNKINNVIILVYSSEESEPAEGLFEPYKSAN